MSGLLQNARRFFQGLAPSPVARAQSFSIACPEGHRLTGLRTDGYQALRCRSCGEGVFVLPRSPLPEPSVPKISSPPPGRPSAEAIEAAFPDPVALSDPVPPPPGVVAEPPGLASAEETLDEIEWDDEATPAVDAPGRRPEDLAAEEVSAARASSRSALKPSSPPRRPKPPAGDEPRPASPIVSLAERLRARRNPLLFAGVGLLVVGTIALRTWSARRAELPRVAELGRTEGLSALDAGKFDRAHQLLSEARRAVIALGDAYQGAAAIRQGADEAEIIARLIPVPLEVVLEEAARAEPDEWARKFETLYKGLTVIIDSQVAAIPDGQGAGRYDLDYRLFREGEGGASPSVGRVDTEGFRLIALIQPKVGDRIAFGARLRSFRFDVAREEWLIGLEPESGVIMTHGKALEALGWSAEGDMSAEDTP